MSGNAMIKNKTYSKTEIDAVEYICHSVLMMRRSRSTHMNRPLLRKCVFLVAVCSYRITNDISKSLFNYIHFNVQYLPNICCDICSDPNVMHNLDTLDLVKEDDYFKNLKPKPDVDWYNILSERLGDDLKHLIDQSMNLLFEKNPLIYEYDATDLSNITRRYNSVANAISFLTFYNELLYIDYDPLYLVRYDKSIISDCHYYEECYKSLKANEDNQTSNSYPYLDLINLYPEHPLYNNKIVNKCKVESRSDNRTKYLNKFDRYY